MLQGFTKILNTGINVIFNKNAPQVQTPKMPDMPLDKVEIRLKTEFERSDIFKSFQEAAQKLGIDADSPKEMVIKLLEQSKKKTGRRLPRYGF